jgi:hypothetical protein
MSRPDTPAYERLLDLLADSIALLRERGDAHWAGWLERDRARIAAGDAYGLVHLKGAFGGMGSIDDTYPADEPDIGAKLSEAYGLAAQLLADLRALS